MEVWGDCACHCPKIMEQPGRVEHARRREAKATAPVHARSERAPAQSSPTDAQKTAEARAAEERDAHELAARRAAAWKAEEERKKRVAQAEEAAKIARDA